MRSLLLAQVLEFLAARCAVLHHKVDVDVVLGVGPCLSQCALVCMVLGVLLGSTVICVGCPGPWILVHKVRCAQVMLSAMMLSLVFTHA